MTAPRPLSIAQVLRATVQVYRRAFLAFLLVALVASIAEAVFNAGYETVSAYADAANAGRSLDRLVLGLLVGSGLLLTFVGYSVVSEVLFGGILILLASNVVLGRAADVLGVSLVVARRLGSLFLVVGVTWVVVFLVAVTILGIPFAIYIGLGWLVAPQVAILEGLGWRDALRRSRDMARWHRWRLLAWYLAIAVALFVPYAVLYTVPSCLLFDGSGGSSWLLACPVPTDASMLVRIADIVLRGIVGALLWPLGPIGVTLLYYDIQVRDERLDLDLRSARRGQSAP